MVKRVVDKVLDNERQIFEMIALILSACIPFWVNLKNIFNAYLNDQPLSPDNFFWQLAIRGSKSIGSVVLVLIALHFIRKFNKDYVMNNKRVYHDYPYTWYWFCAKILGINKCNLVLVPIYTQFKLVIRATFLDYPLDDQDYPVENDEPAIISATFNSSTPIDEVNIVLEDNYKIDIKQIPIGKQGLKTIKISRNNNDNSRHFSRKYIDTVINCVASLKENTSVNIYATTNPMNTKYIAKRAFGSGERGNIKHLYVFQQNKSGNRDFEMQGRKIY